MSHCNNPSAPVRSGRGILAAAFAAAILAALPIAQSIAAPVPLTLINGWTNAPYGTNNAAIDRVGNIVAFKGAIATTGTSAQPFVLPAAYRPATDVYVPVDMCNAANGRLYIQPNGTVTVQAETSFNNAACFTSLDGVKFARTQSGFANLPLENGWVGEAYGTSKAAIARAGGVVYLKGAIDTSGTSNEPFVMPAGFRPSTDVYVPVDLCNATNGRLLIQPDGLVVVQAETDFSNAQCFTSLDGASFAVSSSGFTAVPPSPGWTNAPYNTRNAAVSVSNGIVRFEGALATSGTDVTALRLPAAFRPSRTAYVKVDLCNGTNGRLVIGRNGTVSVQAETDFTNAQCFTSLEGASFVQ